jgi:hypothetical protein
MTQARYDAISGDLIAGIYAGVAPAEAAAGRTRQAGWYADAWPVFQRLQAVAGDLTPEFVNGVALDLLIHTLATTALDAVGRLVGSADGDLAYFHRPDLREFYIFDSVEGGNGCAEAACRRGVTDPDQLQVPPGLVADLQARIRHEYDPIVGARAIVDYLLASHPALFGDWPDLIWLQVLPERFAAAVVAAGICPSLESVRSRTHLCVTGCLECVDNGDRSVYGALASHEYVSRNLLDAVRRHVVATEPQAFLSVPAGVVVGAALQANAGRPVVDGTGAPVSTVIDDNGTQRQVLLTQVLSTVSPDLSLSSGTLLGAGAPGSALDVSIPFLAGYRDERPLP